MGGGLCGVRNVVASAPDTHAPYKIPLRQKTLFVCEAIAMSFIAGETLLEGVG